MQEYNKTYNYFSGLTDGSISDYQKASQLGERPTWKLGQNAHARAGSTRGTARRFDDPLEILGQTQRKPAEQVLGRSDAVQVQILVTQEEMNQLLERLREEFRGTGLRYWASALAAEGEIE